MTTTILPSRMSAIADSIESIVLRSVDSRCPSSGRAEASIRTVRYDGSRRPLRSSEIAASVSPDRCASWDADIPAWAMAARSSSEKRSTAG